MSAEKPSFFGRLREAFKMTSHPPTAEVEGGLRVYLDVSARSTGRTLVGRLTCEGDTWLFQYDSEYAARSDRPPISAFPDKHEVYRSPYLWPFFAVRLPPLEREDIKKVVQERGLDEHDKLHLLGALSQKAVTSPYEFELDPTHA